MQTDPNIVVMETAGQLADALDLLDRDTPILGWPHGQDVILTISMGKAYLQLRPKDYVYETDPTLDE